MTETECWDFLKEWRNKSMNEIPRENLEESDRKWEYIYDTFPDLRLPQGETIFRVHHGGCDEPELSDYEDNGKNQQKRFNSAHDRWKRERDRSEIRFDKHWVSFTKNPMVFSSNYFQSKGMGGFVIVASAKKAVDISEVKGPGFIEKEQEVVAPLDESSRIEVLPLNEFERKYCKTNA
ncbi:hypothetical protein [Bifidobacterium psychraerophilum]|uniref:hypothetical protein n=1 Tax=Bifidobacterium psychraerophilum TaxID=218140 RepID=UPI0039ED64BD